MQAACKRLTLQTKMPQILGWYWIYSRYSHESNSRNQLKTSPGGCHMILSMTRSASPCTQCAGWGSLCAQQTPLWPLCIWPAQPANEDQHCRLLDCRFVLSEWLQPSASSLQIDSRGPRFLLADHGSKSIFGSKIFMPNPWGGCLLNHFATIHHFLSAKKWN